MREPLLRDVDDRELVAAIARRVERGAVRRERHAVQRGAHEDELFPRHRGGVDDGDGRALLLLRQVEDPLHVEVAHPQPRAVRREDQVARVAIDAHGGDHTRVARADLQDVAGVGAVPVGSVGAPAAVRDGLRECRVEELTVGREHDVMRPLQLRRRQADRDARDEGERVRVQEGERVVVCVRRDEPVPGGRGEQLALRPLRLRRVDPGDVFLRPRFGTARGEAGGEADQKQGAGAHGCTSSPDRTRSRKKETRAGVFPPTLVHS